VKVRMLLLAITVLSVAAFPSLASAGAFSGTNGWITYKTSSGSWPVRTFELKGVKPDGTTTTFASWTTTNPTTAVDEVPSWSADGSKVGWYAGSGMSQILTISKMDGSGAQSLGTGGFTSGLAPSISSDGTKIAVALDCDIYLVDAASSQTIGSSTKVIDGASPATCARAPALSSTGAIAYTREGSCGKDDVWVLDNPSPGTPSFGRELRTTCNAGDGSATYPWDRVRGGPTWSPDSSKIIYAVDTYLAADSIYAVNPDDTGKTAIYTTSSASITLGVSPAYSPDGTKIVFTEKPASGFDYPVKYMNADGTGVTTTSATTSDTDSVSWGPLTASGGSGSNSGGSGSNSSSSATTTTTTTTGKPAPGPALKVSDIPAEITLDLGSSTGSSADQPITAEVPCNAPEGQLLDRCTVNLTAPEYVLLGQGDGINVRSDKVISIGKTTVRAKSGKKVIVVKVKINQRGRKALRINTKITATVGLTAITVSNLKSTGDAETTMRLPTQLISPQAGIFDSNSTTLNKAGVAFVNRLAALLPKAPKKMVFIGFTDSTGVPGDNRWLSDRRAKAVRDALEAKGIDPATSSIEVKAATSPRDDNATEQGRERNRRVSIRITY